MRILLQGPSYASSLLSELNRCRLSCRYCDVLLNAGNRKFAAHKAILSCASAYFYNLFSTSPDSSTSTTANAFSLEFISPTNFDKVLTFIYTGEILIDLIDVGVLYELAERLGVTELVQACHTTFPDLQTSKSCKNSPPHLNSSAVVSNSEFACSSAASCSSLSSSAPTPASFSPQQARPVRLCSESLSLKSENLQSIASYGRIQSDQQFACPESPDASGRNDKADLSLSSTLQLKTEQDFPDVEERREEKMHLDAEASLAEETGDLQVVSVQGGDGQNGGFAQPLDTGRDIGEGKLAIMDETAEEERWRQLAGEVIELSDDESFMDDKDEEDEDELVCIESGHRVDQSAQDTDHVCCQICGLNLPLDPLVVRSHAQTHITEGGQCVVCGAAFVELQSGLNHVLSHVGAHMYSCPMCQVHFSSRARLLRHLNASSASYALPADAISSNAPQSPQLQCAHCNIDVNRDFKSVREHTLSHVSPQSLSCSLCPVTLSALCPLLWHALSHLSLPVFTCPHCAMCFVERPLLDTHMTAHAEEAAVKERERTLLQAFTFRSDESLSDGSEELRCPLCPQTFRSSSSFHSHLSSHTSVDLHQSSAGPAGLLGKRKPDSSVTSLRNLGELFKLGPSSFNNRALPGLPQSLSSGTSSLGPNMLPDGVEFSASKPKWYRCRYCGKSFAHSGEFTYHLRIHTGEKPYQCKVCLRFFRGRSTMICHLKTHAGALMYRCTVCGLFFSTLKMVSSHMELHKDHLPQDFHIEQTFMYNDHSKEPLPPADAKAPAHVIAARTHSDYS